MRIAKMLSIVLVGCITCATAQSSNPNRAGQAQFPDGYSVSEKAEPLRSFSPRSLQANKDLVDLTNYYTTTLVEDWPGQPGANLCLLPQGLQILAQSAFDVRGIIQLGGKTGTRSSYPKEIKGINVKNSGTSIHFLQGAVGSAPDDAWIGEYILHFANGKAISIPIIYQRNVRDWVIRKGDQIPTDADIAWTGENGASQQLGSNIQLYNYTAKNPFPEVEIESVDFISAMTGSAPFLIAISMEKNGPGYRKSFRNVRIDNKIQARSPEAGSELVDLSGVFNTSLDDDWINYPGHDFQDVPKGIQTFAGVKFDVRGMVALASASSLSSSRVLFPESVSGIKVNRKGQKIYFLQGCGYADKPDAKIGEYVIHYANGEIRSAPVLYQTNVLDWWCKPEDGPPTNAVDAWRGHNPSASGAGYLIHLIKYTWENPLPYVEIRTIDFVSGFATSVPFLVAITVE
jgi:hypothetical protein